MSKRAEAMTEPCCYHGAGPVWHASWPGLRWVDMFAGDVLTLDRETSEVTRDHVGEIAAVVRPRLSGGVVLAVERGFAFAAADLTNLFPFEPLWTDTTLRLNEGGCAPDGSFFCGSVKTDVTADEGSLFRLDPAGEVTIAVSEATAPGGFAFSPDGATAYYVDAPTQHVDAFDYRDYQLLRRRTIARIDPSAGSPGGIAVDSHGHVWVALDGGGAVRHYTAGGEFVEEYAIPAPRVTACAFGGENLDELYVTTSQVDTNVDEYPQAGSVFRVSGVGPGAPVLPYAG